MRTPSFLLGGAAGLAVGLAASVPLLLADRRSEGARPSAAASPVTAGPRSFAETVKHVSPAVVSVTALDAADASGPVAAPRAMGSGFLVSADGYVVTNHHVVTGAQRLRVTLSDRTVLPARLVGADPATDLALLKVEIASAPYVRFGTAATPQVGDWVLTVGSPFGLGGTATAGIVSAFDRDVGQPWVRYMQIDAPINRGSSGGPAFDTEGRVVGVNTGILAPEGASTGIGFAIPAAIAAEVVAELRAHGRVTRGYLGATVAELDPAAAAEAGLPVGGAVVLDIVPGGPAQAAGLWRGDLIVGLNGSAVASSTQLLRRIAAAGPGATLRMHVVRGDRRLALHATAGERPR